MGMGISSIVTDSSEKTTPSKEEAARCLLLFPLQHPVDFTIALPHARATFFSGTIPQSRFFGRTRFPQR